MIFVFVDVDSTLLRGDIHATATGAAGRRVGWREYVAGARRITRALLAEPRWRVQLLGARRRVAHVARWVAQLAAMPFVQVVVLTSNVKQAVIPCLHALGVLSYVSAIIDHHTLEL